MKDGKQERLVDTGLSSNCDMALAPTLSSLLQFFYLQKGVSSKIFTTFSCDCVLQTSHNCHVRETYCVMWLHNSCWRSMPNSFCKYEIAQSEVLFVASDMFTAVQPECYCGVMLPP